MMSESHNGGEWSSSNARPVRFWVNVQLPSQMDNRIRWPQSCEPFEASGPSYFLAQVEGSSDVFSDPTNNVPKQTRD